jgi:hypothetical protein
MLRTGKDLPQKPEVHRWGNLNVIARNNIRDLTVQGQGQSDVVETEAMSRPARAIKGTRADFRS